MQVRLQNYFLPFVCTLNCAPHVGFTLATKICQDAILPRLMFKLKNFTGTEAFVLDLN